MVSYGNAGPPRLDRCLITAEETNWLVDKAALLEWDFGELS